MKSFKQLKEDIGLSTGTGIANPEIPMGKPVSRGKFAGFHVFDVDESSFHRCRLGKIKFKHWKTFVGEDVQGSAIREFANTNPKKPVIIRNEKTGAMLFARGNHLNFITRK